MQSSTTIMQLMLHHISYLDDSVFCPKSKMSD